MVQVGEEIEVRGYKYRATLSSKPGACGICCFKAGFGCALAEARGSALELCSGKHRVDKVDVWFVPAYLTK